MSRRSRRRRLRERRRGAGRAGQHPRLERLWRLATRPEVLGLLLLGAGILLWVTPLMRRSDEISGAADLQKWWTSAFYAPDMLGVAAALIAAAGILGIGLWWNRAQLGAGIGASADQGGEDLKGDAQAADIALSYEKLPDHIADLTHDTRRSKWPLVGLAGVLLGASLLAGSWFGAQRGVLPAEMTISAGESAENYELKTRGKSLKVNLPRRVRLAELDTGEQARAVVQIHRAGDNPGASPSISRTLPAGAGVQIEGLRVTFSGIKPSADTYRAVLASATPDTIAATVGVGGTFRLGLDGPSYKVTDISENYSDFMGPAVELEGEDSERFWVFQRQNQAALSPNLDHAIKLERVESQPAAVFTVTPVRSFWPMSVGAAFLVLGFALLTLVPERLLRAGPKKLAAWSILDAGRLAETLRAELSAEADVEGRASAELREQKLFRAAVLLGWAGLAVGLGGIYFGLFKSLSALLLTSAAAGLVLMPGDIRSIKAARLAGVGLVVPLGLVILALIAPLQIAGEPTDLMLLLAAQWSLFSAALSAALSAASLGIGAWWEEKRGSSAEEAEVIGLFGRDFAGLALGVGWIFWLVTNLIHWRQFGALSFGSPADWMLFGTLILATASVLLLGSGRRRRFEPVFLLFLSILALGLSFGAPFGLIF